MKLGDLEPDLVVAVTRDHPDDVESGRLPRRRVPLPLDSADEVRMVGYMDKAILFDRVVPGTADGVLTMAWQTGDTDEMGTIKLRVYVIWPTGRPQSIELDDTVRVAR